MGRAVFSLRVFLYLLVVSAWASAQNVTAAAGLMPASTKPALVVPAIIPAIMPLDQIDEGMRGTALTVFQGVKPESMDVEVLGVMHNVNGPKGDIILVRLHGAKPEYTGVVAGMSGSPVYFNGKLAGALAFRIGEFSKEPIAGVTPIEELGESSGRDERPAPVRVNPPAANPPAANSPANSPNQSGTTQTASPGEGSA